MQLAGDLNEFSLTDIIQLVDLSKKTGGVFMRGQRGHEELEGWLYFRDGRIIGAQLDDMPPLEAAYTFFTLSSGPFRFQDDAQPARPTITQSNEMIIMEGIMRHDAWAEAAQVQQTQPMPSMTMVPRLVPNPATNGIEISLEAEEWRVLTMINGTNTVGQIAERSGLGEPRTGEIIVRLLSSGLIEKYEASLPDRVFPTFERIVTEALGAGARDALHAAYERSDVLSRSSATREQVLAAVEAFEDAATPSFDAARLRQTISAMHAAVQEMFSSI